MVLHEFPEGIVTFMLLIRGGFSKRNAWILSLAAAAITPPLGTLASYPVVNRIDANSLAAVLALSAGALIYVGATHPLPFAEKEHRRFSLIALTALWGLSQVDTKTYYIDDNQIIQRKYLIGKAQVWKNQGNFENTTKRLRLVIR
ncbi:ZIP family metal transporter [Hoeflea sp. TYP-13]|uniref:ZIP family metal transporter n=1 Tax=Hoeflea sp. TYP-13 TaxID=3230023 RepID=UPI0034C6B585